MVAAEVDLATDEFDTLRRLWLGTTISKAQRSTLLPLQPDSASWQVQAPARRELCCDAWRVC